MSNPTTTPASDATHAPVQRSVPRLIAYWTVVAIPLAWGVLSTLEKAVLLFK